MKAEITPQHRWLQKLVGERTHECDMPAGPDTPAQKMKGSESVRSLDGAWVLCEGKGSMPDGNPATMLMTLGYDPKKQRFVGTWIGSMMTHLWIYDGELNAVVVMNPDARKGFKTSSSDSHPTRPATVNATTSEAISWGLKAASEPSSWASV